MRNNNGAVIRRLSNRSFKKNRMRNLFAVAAIALTCMLFTAVTSIAIGMMQIAEEDTMREVGTRMHAGLKDATREQMEKVTANPKVKDFSWNIFIGNAENIRQRSGEIRLAGGEEELKNSFIQLAEGGMPKEKDDIIVDTFVLDELKIPYKLGEKVPLTFTFLGKTYQEDFTLCGWYEGDAVSHASEIYLSQAYWEEMKGDMTDQDLVEWNEENQGNGIGLYSVNLWFQNAREIEKNVREVISEAGYEPEEELDYGVNWAYMENRLEQIDPVNFLGLLTAILAILLSGYLIIFNIFQISVFQDIRFYGLLKTVGMTRRQLKKLIRRQAAFLTGIGIPIGLLLGWLVGKAALPFAMSVTNLFGRQVSLKFTPWILVFGALFSIVTVWLSLRKPARIAGKVSPIEAIRVQDGEVRKKKEKRSVKGSRIHRMALSNLGRNRKKTVLVILGMALSMVLFCLVLTLQGSFRIEEYLRGRIIGDVTIGGVRYTALNPVVTDDAVDPEYLERMDSQEGILSRNELWSDMFTLIGSVLLEPEKAEKYKEFLEKGLLYNDEYSVSINQKAVEEGKAKGQFYYYDETLLKNMKVLEGSIDLETFREGGYCLVTETNGPRKDARLYQAGDQIKIRRVSNGAKWEQAEDENGNPMEPEVQSGPEETLEVMAVVELPSPLRYLGKSINCTDIILPKSMLIPEESTLFAVSYEVDDAHLDSFIETAKSYTEEVNPNMGYLDRNSLVKEFSSMTSVIQILGGLLSAVIGLIGVLNFINSTLTGILTRRQEFAVLMSVGMTLKQLKTMLVEEGLYYVLFSGLLGIVLGSGLSYLFLSSLNQVVMFFEYRYNPLAFVIMIPLFTLAAVVAPLAAYRRFRKESIVERLRESVN